MGFAESRTRSRWQYDAAAGVHSANCGVSTQCSCQRLRVGLSASEAAQQHPSLMLYRTSLPRQSGCAHPHIHCRCMDSRHVHAPAMYHMTPLFLNPLPPLPPDDGDYVTLVHNYKQFDDAGRGPLSLQRTDNAFGMIINTSGNRFRVRQGHINPHPHVHVCE